MATVTKSKQSHHNQAPFLQTILSFIEGAIANLFEPRWKFYFYLILPHPTEGKILMLREEDDYFLPYFIVNKVTYSDDFFPDIKKKIEQKLGISVNLLYYASKHYDKSKHQIHGIYILEWDGSIEKIQSGDWINLETLRNLSLKLPEHKPVITEYLTEIENGKIPELRPPWARVGWFDSATQWLKEQLSELNYQPLSSIECIKKWGISCILRVNTNAGNIYFKEASTLPLFCNEPVVTAELANLFPEHIPTVLSIDAKRHWMLLADFGKPIGRNSSLKEQKDIYRLLAQIQIKSVQHIDNLLNIGCLDRRLDWLSEQVDILVNDELVLSQLPTSDITRLQHIAPYLKKLCQQLSNYQIPQTLVHGDLHLGNVAFDNDNYLFFDWTDSCISHPFFDMFQFFFPRGNKRFSPSLRSLRDEYLSQWTIYEPKSRLLEAWTIAKPLCALHHAITYQHIVACVEPREKQELNGLPIFLRELLKCPVERVAK